MCICIRPIYDIRLTSPYTYHPPDRSDIIRSMCGMPSFWNWSRSGIQLREGNWDAVTALPKSFHVGTAQGLMFGLLTVDRNPDANEGSLFPNVVGPKLITGPYMAGTLRGLYLASSYNIAYHQSSRQSKRPPRLARAIHTETRPSPGTTPWIYHHDTAHYDGRAQVCCPQDPTNLSPF